MAIENSPSRFHCNRSQDVQRRNVPPVDPRFHAPHRCRCFCGRLLMLL